MSTLVHLTTQDDIAIITIDNPPVNALSPGVPEGILQALDNIEKDKNVRACVLIGAGSTFVAGADIKEFVKITSGQGKLDALLPLFPGLENCRKPVVVAIHGAAFGGGMEVALAAHYRVALSTAKLGQPEVKLGIIPGAGGTQRLPRLAGVAKAVELCAGGNPITAAEALQFGIIDRVLEGDLLAGAVAFAREIADKSLPKASQRSDKLGTPVENAAIFAGARENARSRQRGLQAPLVAIDAVEAATRLPFDEGWAQERELFQECLFSDQSKALIHLFLAEREAASIPDVPKDTPTRPVKTAAVVGAGTMGGGIAMVFANAGFTVLLQDADEAALHRGLAAIQKNYAASVKRGRLTQEFVDSRLKLIKPTLGFRGFEQVDLAVEAVFENMALKKQVFERLDQSCKPGAILASNTSTLNIDEIASATSRPEAVLGTHFFSPANVMRLLEIVRGKATAKDVIATCLQLAKKLGKAGVLVGNCRGFVGNRIFHPYMREAMFLVEEGAAVDVVDQALYEFGMAMGPLATGDLAGIDVGWRIRQEYRHLEKAGERQPIAADRLYEMGRFGQKTGAGWYRYDENRRPQVDSDLAKLIRQWARDAGIPQREIGQEEIVERCIYAMVNEGARVLEEGYALRAGDIDVIFANGYGFPAHRGGPMWYADTVGVGSIYQRVCTFHQEHGDRWQPAPLLKRLAESGGKFAGFRLENGVAA